MAFYFTHLTSHINKKNAGGFACRTSDTDAHCKVSPRANPTMAGLAYNVATVQY